LKKYLLAAKVYRNYPQKRWVVIFLILINSKEATNSKETCMQSVIEYIIEVGV